VSRRGPNSRMCASPPAAEDPGDSRQTNMPYSMPGQKGHGGHGGHGTPAAEPGRLALIPADRCWDDHDGQWQAADIAAQAGVGRCLALNRATI